MSSSFWTSWLWFKHNPLESTVTLEDANPLVSQGADGGVVRSTVLPSLLVVSLRPERLLTRGVGEFVKGLAQELGQASRQCTQRILPLLSVTGATPENF